MSKYISGGNLLLDPVSILKRASLSFGMNIADLGCGGAGHFILPASQMVGKDGIAYAVDVQKTVLNSVESKAKIEGLNNIKYIWSNIEVVGGTKISGESLDIALVINVLFQIENYSGVFAEAKRLLKTGGKLVVIDWSNSGSPFGPTAEKRVKKEDVVSFAQTSGLKKIEEFEAGQYHYGLIFEKA